jgi:glycyl-tRNA synthetase
MNRDENASEPLDLMKEIVSLSKQRGFVFQSSEIYGGLKSAYDYGPLGTELKRNIMNEWWRAMVYEREDVVGLDASIIMHPKVWEASGHLAGFSDPLVDCRNCKERFRGDKAPRAEPGATVTWVEGGRKGGKTLTGTVDPRGYVCPNCGSSDLSPERNFNLMFRTNLGPVDVVQDIVDAIHGKEMSKEDLRRSIDEKIRETAVYLRPETAQAMFVQFLNVQQSTSMKIPFGIAQMGKSFRNEVTVEHFIFRSCEFEQMEMEFFVEPGTQAKWLDYWKDQRIAWYRRFATSPDKFRLRRHDEKERAHYADDCYDVEYEYPWGWGELEGIASRTDYDLAKHSKHSGVPLQIIDANRPDPKTGKPPLRFTPYVIEPAAGATRATLMFLLDAFRIEEKPRPNAKGEVETRRVLKLHPRLAPYKVAVLPLVKKDGMPEVARQMVSEFYRAAINARYDEQHSIGKRYARHDEIGTPYCITVDGDSVKDGVVTIRDRDTTEQVKVKIDEALAAVKERLSR